MNLLKTKHTSTTSSMMTTPRLGAAIGTGKELIV